MREKEKENKPISIAERAPASGLEGWNKKPTWILDHHLTPTNVHLPSSALQTSGPTMKITIVTVYRYKTLPKPLVTAQRTQGIEYFDSFNTFTSKQKLQQALKSWWTFSLFFLAVQGSSISDSVGLSVGLSQLTIRAYNHHNHYNHYKE